MAASSKPGRTLRERFFDRVRLELFQPLLHTLGSGKNNVRSASTGGYAPIAIVANYDGEMRVHLWSTKQEYANDWQQVDGDSLPPAPPFHVIGPKYRLAPEKTTHYYEFYWNRKDTEDYDAEMPVVKACVDWLWRFAQSRSRERFAAFDQGVEDSAKGSVLPEVILESNVANAGDHCLIAFKYELRSRLGSGGFGDAYEATDRDNGRVVVVKLANDEDNAAERLRSEFDITQGLAHPNICTYFDFGVDPNYGAYLVMEHGGKSLRQWLEEGRVFDANIAIRIVEQCAEAVCHALSQRGIIHQDLNPGNVLLADGDAEPRVRLADFGIASHSALGEATGGRSTMLATSHHGLHPAYVAPEVLVRGQAESKSDQYCLGLLFCSMLEGEVFTERYEPRSFCDLTDEQNSAVKRALSFDPGGRFDSCRDFARALR